MLTRLADYVSLHLAKLFNGPNLQHTNHAHNIKMDRPGLSCSKLG